MRLRLTMEPGTDDRTLPLNYQYELSAWIYRTLHQSSPNFSRWLNEQGYTHQGKRFKHFTFSGIKVPKRKVKEDRLTILSPEVEMQISFGIPESATHFIGGLFQNQTFHIGDRYSRARLTVKRVEQLGSPELNDRFAFRTLSPVCLTQAGEQNYATYLSPVQSNYDELLTQNLRNRFKSLYPDREAPAEQVSLKLKSEPKSRMIRIKSHRASETRIRGFLFHGIVEGPSELLKIGYESGFGEKGSLGFGCVERI